MTVDVTQPTSQDGLTLQELSLYHSIMNYRASLGLAAIPLSRGLTTTAGRHVVDTRENIWAAGVVLPDGASLHSWSDAYYYSDNRDPSVMWTAPQRVNSGYGSAGYEISAAGFLTTDLALEGWKASPSHDAILTQTGVWANIELKAIGVGVDTSEGAGIYRGRIFHVWFGETTDAAIPDISGTADADYVLGTLFADRIFAGAGNDDISGSEGNDEIYGSDGDDVLRGDAGADSLFGESGADFLGGAGGADRLQGGAGDDVLSGGGGMDRLQGGPGNDVLGGGDGADRLWGNDGADRLNGGAGEDILIGGIGGDVLTGGTEADIFVFNALADSPAGPGQTVIVDFETGIDRIDLSRIDANIATVEDEAFAFIGTAEFSGLAGELRAGNSAIAVDVDGDRVPDMLISVNIPGNLSVGDFIL